MKKNFLGQNNIKKRYKLYAINTKTIMKKGNLYRMSKDKQNIKNVKPNKKKKKLPEEENIELVIFHKILFDKQFDTIFLLSNFILLFAIITK